MHSTDYAVARRPSVCLSDRHTPVFCRKWCISTSTPTRTHNGGIECRGIKNRDLRPISRFISEIIQYTANDIALLSCSCYELQKLTDICYDYGIQWDIKFNPEKSQAATFGGNSPPVSVILGDAALGWVSKVKYLGCYAVPVS